MLREILKTQTKTTLDNQCQEALKHYQDTLANVIYDIGARAKPELIKASVEMLTNAIKSLGKCLNITEELDYRRATREMELLKENLQRGNFTGASFHLASIVSLLARTIWK